jgi:hypothetical protein
MWHQTIMQTEEQTQEEFLKWLTDQHSNEFQWLTSKPKKRKNSMQQTATNNIYVENKVCDSTDDT